LVAVREAVQRFRAVRKLRLQVTRDLHDEIGSSLGSIALTLEDVAGMVSEPEAREDIEEVVLMAREASAGINEVIWLTGKGTVRLPELLEQLVERARRVLRGVNVSVELPDRIPDVAVSLSFRRHLVMFFREAVYNCARHARAAQATLRFSDEGDILGIGIADDGCGFDPEHARPGGLGLNSLKQRAREMGGEMRLESTPGKGTLIELRVPLKSVQRSPYPPYKTSN
jgi:signal transduction histidine kinase